MLTFQRSIRPDRYLAMCSSRPKLFRRLALIAALTVAAVAVLVAPAAATHNSEHVVPAFGVGALRAETLAEYPLGLQDLERMGQARLGLYRARFRQDQVLVDGNFSNWSGLDKLATTAALNGVALQPVLMNMPLEVYTPPKTDAERASFAEFAAAAVRRYGPGGSFWETCGCPTLPAMAWEVWNEPNVAPFWDSPSPAEYGALLEETAAALRGADPTVRVLFGGLAYPTTLSATELGPNAFLRDVIAAVGADDFDALALHNYRPNPDRAVNVLIADTVGTLRTYAGTTADGAPRQQVWLNEFGRPTLPDNATTLEDEQAASEEAQRAWLETFLGLLLPHRADWNLGPAMWYSLRDGPAATASWERLGLRRTTADDTDGGPKPSWALYTAHSTSAELLYLPGLYTLSVARTGGGTGTVSSDLAGIDCGAACSGSYAAGAVITLTATPDSGSSFAGWSGDCSGTGSCTLTMSEARDLSAEFVPVPEAPANTPTTASLTSVTVEPTAGEQGDVNAADTTAPAITRLALAPMAFHAARSGRAVAAAIGTRLSFELSETATVGIRVARAAPGRQVAGECRRLSARNADRPSCTRWITLRGRILLNLSAGPHALRYRGRLAGRTLSPGRYRLRIRARDTAGNASPQRSAKFTVLQ